MLLEPASYLLNLVLVQVREKRHMLEDFNNLSRRERDHRLCFLKNLKHAARRVIVSYESSRVYRACARLDSRYEARTLSFRTLACGWKATTNKDSKVVPFFLNLHRASQGFRIPRK